MLMTVLMLMSVAWIPLIHLPEKDNILEETVEEQPTITTTQNFATNNGFTHTNLTQDSVTGLTVLERPPISWTTPSGFGLTSLRTGACSAYLPSTNEVYLIGGRVDVDPSQTGDEASTTLVEVFDMVNKTWSPSTSILPEVQQYHNCAVAGGKIYAIGDHYPFASPSVEATGLVQVFDPTTGNWTDGTSMPGNQSVGLAGTASQDGMIYVAGGVSAHDRSDSTDRLLRYDPINDTWTQLASMNNERHSFQLVSYKGKLIAFGGVAIYFDPIANTTVEGETNLTEAYDPPILGVNSQMHPIDFRHMLQQCSTMKSSFMEGTNSRDGKALPATRHTDTTPSRINGTPTPPSKLVCTIQRWSWPTIPWSTLVAMPATHGLAHGACNILQKTNTTPTRPHTTVC